MSHMEVLWHHPLIFAKKAVGKLRRRLISLPSAPQIRVLNGSVRFEHRYLPFLDEDDLRAMLTGSYDIFLCDFLKKSLSTGDTFLDVGANVGYISAIAASYVGTSGEVHGFEPLPECFARLQVLSKLNPEFRFLFQNLALGEQEGSLPISYNPKGDSRNATLVPGKHYSDSYQVPVQRLDDYIFNKIRDPKRITVIKIDVEGFEFAVLRGLERFFAETNCRPVIVCEVKPWEVSKLGYTMGDFDAYMKRWGYQTYGVLRPQRIEFQSMQEMDVVVFRASGQQ